MVTVKEWRVRLGKAPVQFYAADTPREAAELFFKDEAYGRGAVLRVTGEPGMPGAFLFRRALPDGGAETKGRVVVWMA